MEVENGVLEDVWKMSPNGLFSTSMIMGGRVNRDSHLNKSLKTRFIVHAFFFDSTTLKDIPPKVQTMDCSPKNTKLNTYLETITFFTSQSKTIPKNPW